MAKKGRNGNHQGNIRSRADGRWEVRVTLPDGTSKSYYARTKSAAQLRLRQVLYALDTGAHIVRDERLTVSRFLEDWLERRKHDDSLRPRTLIRYRELMAHVCRVIGDRQLTKLTAAQIERLYADMRAKGSSSSTCHHVHVVLRQALADAERLGYISRNVVAHAKAPRMRRVETQVFTPDQARAFLAAAQGERLEALYVVAISTGMRQGELLALRWRDVDLIAGSLEVRGTLYRVTGEGFHIGPPKTRQSRRRVPLTPHVVAALRAHKARQSEERRRGGFGLTWGDPRWPDLVFTNESGQPITGQDMVRYHYYPLLKRAGLPKIRFHDLRHTFTSLVLAEGINALDISKMLGHSSPEFTMKRYGHQLDSRERAAAEAMARAIHRDTEPEDDDESEGISEGKR